MHFDHQALLEAARNPANPTQQSAALDVIEANLRNHQSGASPLENEDMAQLLAMLCVARPELIEPD